MSHSELTEKSGETHSEADLGAEAESDSELNMDLNSGLKLDQEEDEEEELEAAVQSETDPVNVRTADFSAAEEDNDKRGDSNDLGESEFLSAKNEQLPSLSNSEKHRGIAAPRPRKREIEEQNKEIERNDSLLWLVEEKLAVDREKRRAIMFSGGVHPDPAIRLAMRLLTEFYGEKGKGFCESSSVVREEPQEIKSML